MPRATLPPHAVLPRWTLPRATQCVLFAITALWSPASAGHPSSSGSATGKTCAATGAQPSCAIWCSDQYLTEHCRDCQCAGCDWCKEADTCEPLPGSDDTHVQQCHEFCREKDKKQHCLRCSCQKCDYVRASPQDPI